MLALYSSLVLIALRSLLDLQANSSAGSMGQNSFTSWNPDAQLELVP